MQNPGLEPRSVPPPPAEPVGGALATGRPTNTLAIVSLVAGVLGFVPFPHPFIAGVVAIITGHMARGQIRRTGEGGLELATVGLILGYAHLALSLALTVFVVLLLLGLVSLAVFGHR